MDITVEDLLQRLGYRDMEVNSLLKQIKEKDEKIKELENKLEELQNLYDQNIGAVLEK